MGAELLVWDGWIGACGSPEVLWHDGATREAVSGACGSPMKYSRGASDGIPSLVTFDCFLTGEVLVPGQKSEIWRLTFSGTKKQNK